MNFRRNSTEKTSRRSFHRESKPLHPEDFDDVFGGPPRTVSSRQFSGGEIDQSDYFYDDIFRNPMRVGAKKGSRKLPEFRIPAGERGGGCAVGRRSEDFCSDFLRMDFNEVRRSRSRSKSNSSSASVLSSEEFSPFRPPVSDDDAFSPVYASKLRPINGQSKRDASTRMHEVQERHDQETPQFPYSRPCKQFVDDEQTENFRSTFLNFSRRASSPESMSRGAYSYSSVKVSVVDEDDYTNEFHIHGDDDDEDDDEISSSYVIEINPGYRQRTDEGVGVDEAIAWAKESYQSHSSPEESSASITERSSVLQFPDESVDGCKSLHLQREYPNKVKSEEERKIDESVQKKMELLEEEIKLWSSGKERNLELLLSTLQDILWPNSGWYPVPLTNLYESSHVKKAYQKARLCLHPDKLQQRGATLLQKYVAERIFPILQEAWAAYKLQDIIVSAGG